MYPRVHAMFWKKYVLDLIRSCKMPDSFSACLLICLTPQSIDPFSVHVNIQIICIRKYELNLFYEGFHAILHENTDLDRYIDEEIKVISFFAIIMILLIVFRYEAFSLPLALQQGSAASARARAAASATHYIVLLLFLRHRSLRSSIR